MPNWILCRMVCQHAIYTQMSTWITWLIILNVELNSLPAQQSKTGLDNLKVEQNVLLAQYSHSVVENLNAEFCKLNICTWLVWMSGWMTICMLSWMSCQLDNRGRTKTLWLFRWKSSKIVCQHNIRTRTSKLRLSCWISTWMLCQQRAPDQHCFILFAECWTELFPLNLQCFRDP